MEKRQAYMKLISAGSFNCKICKYILQSPVYLSSFKGNLCGDCHETREPKNDVCMKNTEMDKLLEEMSFPCEFEKNGCIMFLEYNKFLEHRKSCVYKPTFHCIFRDCKWLDTKSNFWEHLSQSHKNEILDTKNDVFKLSFADEDMEVIKILPTSKGRFISRIQKASDKFRIIMFDADDIVPSNSKLEFNVRHISDSGQALKFRCKITNNIEDVIHFKQQSVTEFKIDLPEPRNSLFKVELKFKCGQNNQLLSSIVMDLFRCNYCKCQIRTDFYECEMHRFCTNCENVHQLDCKLRVGINVKMMEVAKTLRHPCQFQQQGCKVICSSSSDGHESRCEYRTWKCPVDGCAHQAPYSKLICHMKESHFDQCILGNSRLFSKCDLKQNFYFLIANDIFIMEYNELNQDSPSRYRRSHSCNSDHLQEKTYHTWTLSRLGVNKIHDFSCEVGVFSISIRRKSIQSSGCYIKNDQHPPNVFKVESLDFPNDFVYSVLIQRVK